MKKAIVEIRCTAIDSNMNEVYEFSINKRHYVANQVN